MPYMEFRNFGVDFDEKKRQLTCFTADDRGRRQVILNKARVLSFSRDGKIYKASAYDICTAEPIPDVLFTGKLGVFVWEYKLHFKDSKKKLPPFDLEMFFHADKIVMSCKKGTVELQGVLCNGKNPASDQFLMKSASRSAVLHGASGPAPLPGADMLYNRKKDDALVFNGSSQVSFDWKKKNYTVTARISSKEKFVLSFKRHVCQELYSSRIWKSQTKNHRFKTPPVGWMTWYSLRFGACEQAVLENAAAMKKHFGNFNKDICIWVDWEWCHGSLDGKGIPGVDVMHPRKDAYPNGLAFVARKLKELGLVPGLWTGATNDGDMNELFKKNPALLLADMRNWAGHFWADLSHPDMLTEYIPRIFNELKSWGYEAFKWDCLLNTLRVNDECVDKRFDPALSSDEALHRVVKTGRKVMGKDVYLLGCTVHERSTMATFDQFDACRIGGDVFSWNDFKIEAVMPIFHYFPMHNNAIYLDPDTLVLREEYSTLEQARSRVTLFALTGMQLTVGDPLDQLDEPRIDALKRAMPVPEIRAAEMVIKPVRGNTACIVNAVSRPFGTWYIAGICNLTSAPEKVSLDLQKDLDLPSGNYAVFDFWNKKYLGIFSDEISFDLPPGASAALRLTPVENKPILIGSTRHLMQGAVELENCSFDEKNKTLSVTVQAVAEDSSELWFYAPGKYSFRPQKGLEISGQTARWQYRSSENTSLNLLLSFE